MSSSPLNFCDVTLDGKYRVPQKSLKSGPSYYIDMQQLLRHSLLCGSRAPAYDSWLGGSLQYIVKCKVPKLAQNIQEFGITHFAFK